MAVLSNCKHEQFAQLVVKGVSASKAYVSVGYSHAGAAQGAARLLRNAKVCSHVAEIRVALAEGVIQREITERNARVGLLQDLVDRIRKVIAERGADMADVPAGGTLAGGASAQGREADAREPRSWPVYRRSGNGEAEGLWNVMEVGCMAVLDNSKHEHFAQLVAKGVREPKSVRD